MPPGPVTAELVEQVEPLAEPADADTSMSATSSRSVEWSSAARVCSSIPAAVSTMT